MKTEVIMERNFLYGTIKQKSKSGFFSATDLVRSGNSWRKLNGMTDFNMSNWLNSKSTLEFISILEKDTGKNVISIGRGRNSQTWVHPFLFIDMALAINPQLKIKVYNWLYDELLKYRNNSGDSYKKMCGALMLNMSNKSEVTKVIKEYAVKIRTACGLNNEDVWETQNQEILKLRDKIHEYVSMMSDIIRDKNNLIDISIEKATSK